MKIQTIKSPGGIEAWLVEEHSVPLVALRFAFNGGSAQDPKGKEGVANFLSAMLDEGAGDLESGEFQERMEEIAMRMSFSDDRDHFFGNVQTLTANRDDAMQLLKLALSRPRFDAPAMERIRKQIKAGLVFAARDPGKVAAKRWFAEAFGEHPYGRPTDGTEDSVSAILRDDLEAYRKRTFTKANLKVVAVGDINADQLGKLLDEVFGDLPDNGSVIALKDAVTVSGKQKVFEMNVPQSVAMFGLPSLKRKDPDFMTAFVLNHIVGGGGFASKLMEEVREKRGLAYSVYSYLWPHKHAAVLVGSVATKNSSIAESLEVIRNELGKVSKDGPTQEELDNAKNYLVGSYPLRFDTNAKIASQLMGVLVEELGIDYIETRNSQIQAVTLEDVKRVAKTLLKPEKLLVTVVGKPEGL